MSYKYVTNISEGKAVMLLGKQIGNSYNERGEVTTVGIDGFQFASEIKNLHESGVQDITVNINSIGGSIIEGYNIAYAIKEYGCNTRVVGLAASMAFVCACMGKTRTAESHSMLMSHEVSSSDDKMKGITQDSLINMVSSATRMNGDTTKQLFEKETYFSNSSKSDYTLNQAKEMGIIDDIEDSGKKMSIKKSLSLQNIYNAYNQLTTETSMKNVNAVLSLKEGDPENLAVDAIKALQNKLQDAESRATEAEKKLKDKEEADKAKSKKDAEDLVNSAETKIGKNFEAGEKAKLVALAEVDFGTVKNLLDSKIGASKPVHAFNKADAGKSVPDDRASWTIRDWEKKDARGLKALKNESAELYQQMYDNYYKHGIGNETFNK